MIDVFDLFEWASMETCVGRSRKYVNKLRREMTTSYKRRVRKAIFLDSKVMKRERKKFADFHLHHILPLSFGGDNHVENLALVEPTLHQIVHVFFREQVEAFPEGYRQVCVPRLPGRIWSLERLGL